MTTATDADKRHDAAMGRVYDLAQIIRAHANARILRRGALQVTPQLADDAEVLAARLKALVKECGVEP